MSPGEHNRDTEPQGFAWLHAPVRQRPAPGALHQRIDVPFEKLVKRQGAAGGERGAEKHLQ